MKTTHKYFIIIRRQVKLNVKPLISKIKSKLRRVEIIVSVRVYINRDSCITNLKARPPRHLKDLPQSHVRNIILSEILGKKEFMMFELYFFHPQSILTKSTHPTSRTMCSSCIHTKNEAIKLSNSLQFECVVYFRPGPGCWSLESKIMIWLSH